MNHLETEVGPLDGRISSIKAGFRWHRFSFEWNINGAGFPLHPCLRSRNVIEEAAKQLPQSLSTTIVKQLYPFETAIRTGYFFTNHQEQWFMHSLLLVTFSSLSKIRAGKLFVIESYYCNFKTDELIFHENSRKTFLFRSVKLLFHII